MAADNSNAPLALSELTRWVSKDTLAWLEDADNKEKAWKDEVESEGIDYTAGLFETDKEKEEAETAIIHRVRAWSTSRDNPDGIFHWQDSSRGDPDEEKDADGVRIVYILSDSWQGYGDILWASARHISNLLGNAESCRKVLAPLLHDQPLHCHPLEGVSFVELGAGAGVPSWTAMRCGARVVCTDQRVADRIRCIAECAERNWREMKETLPVDNDVLRYAERTRAYPYDWGSSVDEITSALNNDELFDVVVAADCCYMPWLQPKLLDSIQMLMSDRGVALIPFALHGNAADDDVWAIVDRAREKGFHVEVLEPKQLTPPNPGMESKQALVQTVRLTKQ